MNIINFLNEKSKGNIKSTRRLGKGKIEADTNSSTKVWRKPLLVTCENDRGWFMERCFHKSYKVQQFDYPVYLKRFLTSAERSLEKKVLGKRYSMIHEENFDKHDFKIKNLVLYYKGKEVRIADNRPPVLNAAVINCQSLKSSSKQQKRTSLIVAHDIHFLFLCETFLHTDIKTSEAIQGSCFKEIDRTDRNKGEHG